MRLPAIFLGALTVVLATALWWVIAVHDVLEFHPRTQVPTLRQP